MIERSFYTEYSYESRENYINFLSGKDIRNIINNSLIIIDKEYFKKYHRNNAEILIETKFYYLIKVFDSKIEQYLNIYKDNFTS